MKRLRVWAITAAIIIAGATLVVPSAYARIDTSDPGTKQQDQQSQQDGNGEGEGDDQSACGIAGYSDPLLCGVEGRDNELILIERVKNVLNTVYLWIGIIAVIVIIIAGITYMTSQGQPDKTKRAKGAILYAIIGLVIALGAFAITAAVISSLEGQTQNTNGTTNNGSSGNNGNGSNGGNNGNNGNNGNGGNGGSTSNNNGGGSNSNNSGGSIIGKDRDKVKSIDLQSGEDVNVVIGKLGTIVAKAQPSYAKNKTLKYTVDKSDIVSVNQSGRFKGKKLGDATITITSPDGPQRKVTVHVVMPVLVSKIYLSSSKFKIKKALLHKLARP